MKRSFFSLFGLLASVGLLGACAIPNTIEGYDELCPPPEFGRPGWVRVCAGAGAWVGGIVGGVASVVLLPVTYPLSLLAEDGLGEHSSSEFLLFPALGGAAIGHCLLGTPPDVLDYLFRRVWVGSGDITTSYDFVPMPGPVLPGRDDTVPVPAPVPVPQAK